MKGGYGKGGAKKAGKASLDTPFKGKIFSKGGK